MTRRFYLCPIIGAGTEDDPYRPKVAEYPVSWTAQIVSGADGRPAQAMVIAEVETDDHSALLADADLTDVTVG